MWNLFRNPQMFNMNGGSAATARPNFGLRSSPEESEKAWALLEIDWRTLNHAQLANYMPQYQQLLTRMVDETGLMQKSLKQRSGAPPEPEKNCVVCREAPPELCFAPCGHSTMCLDCHIIWQSLDNRTCPLCKTAVTDTFYRRMYERKLLSCDEYTQRGLAHTVSEVSKLLLYIDKHPETIEKLAHGKKAVSDIMKESEKGR
ncbi:hypothetical protein SARC_11114 [Sphaeroforma arctica JP610]|uniref:RING-type domain-containing protein n=1 Tax=Sphaeroforma arctica JP610 TaxID=667725 RepID=A0A0L0FHW8_9EUKA|nr:hypothetical protein SARC_11114 [Sphaeroforma arctica JP610]KNC76382.1 hypothetical protein SARC_11114 [Sphaeroforma arctica JP610]|eukprot:XP_014150284.1 hypothetical protein SARC_11114 [Sphaeroforma arctica JP610]